MVGRRSVVACCLLVVSAGGAAAARAQGPIEHRVKAAVIAKLAQFVEWPPASAARPTADLCVAGGGELLADLLEIEAGEVLQGRPVAVRQVAREADLDGCRVLVLPAAQASQAPHPLLRRAATLPILTISDHPRFLEDGGIVRLRLIDGRVRFDIDDAAAQQRGLRISAQVLQLAASVRRRNG